MMRFNDFDRFRANYHETSSGRFDVSGPHFCPSAVLG
jgi:hypothetical protein